MLALDKQNGMQYACSGDPGCLKLTNASGDELLHSADAVFTNVS